MMRNVVEEGTGTAAALEGVEVAGKTGTAEVNLQGLNDAWFIGFTDRFAVAVVIERVQGGTGGELAAPIAEGRPQVARRELMHGVERDTVIDGRYRVLKRLGSGGMADVYCAEDTQLGRQVALKLLYRRFAEDAEFVERFRREASSAAGLQHPNIVGVFDRGEWDGTYYIAMEFLQRADAQAARARARRDAPGPRDRHHRSRCCAPPASRTSAASCTATSSPTT